MKAMYHLLKLELKKASLGWYWKGAIVANFLIVVTVYALMFMGKFEVEDIPFYTLEEGFFISGLFVRAVFIVFAAVLLAKLVIEEYKNKTINILFALPVQRKKLLSAKLALVFLLTFVTILGSDIVVSAALWLGNSVLQVVDQTVTFAMLIEKVGSTGMYALAAAGTSLIPLYFGMRQKSVPATIVSSIIIVALISSYNPGFSIATIIYIPFTLAVVGLCIAAIAVHSVEKTDVL
ncbi:hypothetical protein CHH70_17485 [Shouchella clausii]|nr:hypothetical protein CHH70_17485 [Shouchella clausii]